MHRRASELVERYGLAPHPEGGFYREVFRSISPVMREHDGARRTALTSIYYLLPAGTFSAFHRVMADEVWHYYEGDPASLHLLSEHGSEVVRLGPKLERGEHYQYSVPASVYQATVPDGSTYSFFGCTVGPGFSFEDFEMPKRGELLARFPAAKEWVTRLTRE